MENNMDITLTRIIETDKASREKVNEKKQRLLALDSEIAEAKQNIDDELYTASQKSIGKQAETAEIKLKKELIRIDDFYAEAENNLRTSFNKSREELTEKIFEKITK